MTDTPIAAFHAALTQRARTAGVFADVRVDAGRLLCRADAPEAEAYYYVEPQPDRQRVWVGLYTPDRWVSESIEADLLHTGDKMEELLEDELVERGSADRLTVEHFRDDAKRYTFRSALALGPGQALDAPAGLERVAAALLAYEAAFRNLGDLAPPRE